MVTDETIRGLNSNLPPEELAKPSTTPLQLAKLQWLGLYGVAGTVNMNCAEINNRITIIGDSDEKDGGLARNAGVRFIRVTPESSSQAWRSLQAVHNIGSHAVAQTAA